MSTYRLFNFFESREIRVIILLARQCVARRPADHGSIWLKSEIDDEHDERWSDSTNWIKFNQLDQAVIPRVGAAAASSLTCIMWSCDYESRAAIRIRMADPRRLETSEVDVECHRIGSVGSADRPTSVTAV